MGNLSRRLLTIYSICIILGLTSSFLGIFFPFLNICLPLFWGRYACTAIGSYLVILVNLPGYIVSALILPSAKTIPEIYSFILVGGISIGFYYLIGRVLEREKGQGPSLKKCIIRIVLGSTVFLAFLFLYLLFRIRM